MLGLGSALWWLSKQRVRVLAAASLIAVPATMWYVTGTDGPEKAVVTAQVPQQAKEPQIDLKTGLQEIAKQMPGAKKTPEVSAPAGPKEETKPEPPTAPAKTETVEPVSAPAQSEPPPPPVGTKTAEEPTAAPPAKVEPLPPVIVNQPKAEKTERAERSQERPMGTKPVVPATDTRDDPPAEPEVAVDDRSLDEFVEGHFPDVQQTYVEDKSLDTFVGSLPDTTNSSGGVNNSTSLDEFVASHFEDVAVYSSNREIDLDAEIARMPDRSYRQRSMRGRTRLRKCPPRWQAHHRRPRYEIYAYPGYPRNLRIGNRPVRSHRSW